MLSGCDYLPSIHGMGLKTAYKYLCKYAEIGRVLQALRAEMPAKMPAEYETDFSKADLTFAHQRIYDMDRRQLAFLNPLPLDFDYDAPAEQWSFLGPELPEALIREICEGRVCPATRQPFISPPPLPVATAAVDPSLATIQLPFQVHLDRGKGAPLPPSPSTVAVYGRAVAAARVSLKRTYCTGEGENRRGEAAAVPRFAFSKSDLLRGIPAPLSSAAGRSRGPLGTLSRNATPITKVDIKQRSIRDFFK